MLALRQEVHSIHSVLHISLSICICMHSTLYYQGTKPFEYTLYALNMLNDQWRKMTANAKANVKASVSSQNGGSENLNLKPDWEQMLCCHCSGQTAEISVKLDSIGVDGLNCDESSLRCVTSWLAKQWNQEVFFVLCFVVEWHRKGSG